MKWNLSLFSFLIVSQTQSNAKNILEGAKSKTSSNKHQELEAVVALPLPLPFYYTTSVYDGDDSIYIFGGDFNSYEIAQYRVNIYQYKISNNSVIKLGTIPAEPWRNGAVKDSQGNIFYFTQYSIFPGSVKVYRLDTKTNNVKDGATFDDEFYYRTSFAIENSSFALVEFRSNGNQSLGFFNFNSSTISGINTRRTDLEITTTVVHRENVLIFYFRFSGIEVLNFITLNSVYNYTSLPVFSFPPVAVSDGYFVYIFGDYDNQNSTISNGGLIRLDPNKMKYVFLPVKNFPTIDYGADPSAVYVKKLNRIYIIGGTKYMSRNGHRETDKISYIELGKPVTMMDTDLEFSCTNKANGFHPAKSNKEFFGCDNGTANVFFCPAPLLYDAEMAECSRPKNDASNMEMGLNQKSSIKAGCKDGVLNVFECHPELIMIH